MDRKKTGGAEMVFAVSRLGQAAGCAVAPVSGGESGLSRAGLQLQDAVAELERLVFESPSLDPRCHEDVLDAIGLVMEAQQMLGHARSTLDRAQAVTALGLSAQLLESPIGRA